MFSAEQKAVYIQDDAGKLTDAATGQPIAGDPPADLDNVRVNNRLRGVIDAALGGLTLLSRDPEKRFDAAQAVFKSREASTADARKGHRPGAGPPHQTGLDQARAAILLNTADSSEADKLDAIEIIRERGDQDALALLSDLPAREPPAVAKAAAMRSQPSKPARCGMRCKISGTAFRSARCCCSPPSVSPLPSVSWA